MKPGDAEEYTQALGQVVAGGWRQIALGQRLGVPQALGLKVDEWVKERLGGYVQLSIKEHDAAATELTAEGHSLREIAGILGTGKSTVHRAIVPNGTVSTELPQQTSDSPNDSVPNGTHSEPIDGFAAMAATNEIRQAIETKASRDRREDQREARRQANAAKVIDVSDPRELIKRGRFATIVIDPPWDFADEGDANPLGQAKGDYASLSMDEILQLPVDVLADADCHLYLWITNRSLPKGFRLLEAWGFRYITCLTWVKPSFGIGTYFRGQTEQVLFGVKGSQPLKRKDVGTVLRADRGDGGHSSKPVEFFELVESCSPSPYLEIFSREERDGWTVWGEDSVRRRDGVSV